MSVLKYCFANCFLKDLEQKTFFVNIKINIITKINIDFLPRFKELINNPLVIYFKIY